MFSLTTICLPFFFFFNDTATTEIYTLSLHDALPIYYVGGRAVAALVYGRQKHVINVFVWRSEEHTSELQSLRHLVCRLLLEKKKQNALLERLDFHGRFVALNRDEQIARLNGLGIPLE